MSDRSSAVSRGKWSDDQFLDTLRGRGDQEADCCFAALSEELERRHYAEAADNPDGAELSRANQQMLNDLLPQTPLRRLGTQIVPRIYMEILMGRPALLRVGIKPLRGLFLTKWLLSFLSRLWMRFWDLADTLDPKGGAHENLSRIFFQGLINRGIGGRVEFSVPDSLAGLRAL